MDLLLVIVIGLTIAVLLGCVFLEHSDNIHDYLTSTSITLYDQYKINMIDDTDAEYIKAVIPEEILNKVLVKLLPEDKRKCPNDSIDTETLLDTKERNFGNELPWDTDVTSCDILKDTDQDLYKNVQNSHVITFY